MSSLSDHQIKLLSAKPIGNLLSSEFFPRDLFSEGMSLLDSWYYTDYSVFYGDNSVSVTVEMLWPEELEVSLFGLDYVRFGVGEEGFFPFKVRVTWTNVDLNVLIENIELNLIFSRDLLLPAEEAPSGGYQVKTGDERAKFSATGSLYLDKDFDIEVRGFDQFTLEPVKLPNLNSVFLVVEGVELDLSRSSAIPEVLASGFDQDFQGLYVRTVTATFQDDLEFLPDITAENFAIRTGGISGKITATFDLTYDANQKKFEGASSQYRVRAKLAA